MRKLLICMIPLLLFYGCSKDNTENSIETTGLKEIKVIIELPNNSKISSNDLTVSSLFTENSQGKILTFDEKSIELTYATNSQGNLVMLSYFDPFEVSEVIMNSETTAIAMVMLHPWTFDLSDNAKSEAIQYIKNLPEFESYKLIVENSIKSDELNPLHTQPILDAVSNIRKGLFQKNDYIEPLRFNIENATATVKNVSSSASYSIGLYDENDVFIEHKLAEGLDKSNYLFQDYFSNYFQEKESDNQTASFKIPTDGKWVLKAKSGLSFDESLENQQAAFYNTKTVVANTIGIFSSKLKKIIKKGECFISLGESVYNGVSGSINIKESLQQYSNGTKTSAGLSKDILYYLSDRFQNIKDLIEGCASETTDLSMLNKLQSGFFGKIFGFINITSKVESSFNAGAMLGDWIQYDKNIEYCFTKNGNVISECKDAGQWYKGSYTLDYWKAIDCGSQYGQTGEVYVYISNTPQWNQVVTFYKSILAGLPDVYYGTEYNGLKTLVPSWANSDTYATENLSRRFSLGLLKISDDRNTISTHNNIYGEAMREVPYGTGINCTGISYGDYAYYYQVINVELKSVGADPPNPINKLDLERINSILGNRDLVSIAIEK